LLPLNFAPPTATLPGRRPFRRGPSTGAFGHSRSQRLELPTSHPRRRPAAGTVRCEWRPLVSAAHAGRCCANEGQSAKRVPPSGLGRTRHEAPRGGIRLSGLHLCRNRRAITVQATAETGGIVGRAAAAAARSTIEVAGEVGTDTARTAADVLADPVRGVKGMCGATVRKATKAPGKKAAKEPTRKSAEKAARVASKKPVVPLSTHQNRWALAGEHPCGGPCRLQDRTGPRLKQFGGVLRSPPQPPPRWPRMRRG
jgi:hypothetical protein